MEIAVIENHVHRVRLPSKHNWIQILYMITSTMCFLIEIYQRISIDSSYTLTYIHMPSLNRYPTEFTASYTTISYIWYLVYIWQALWIIYSFIGIFRRTPSNRYFYQYPCAMNEWAFFYTTIARLLYIPQLLSANENTYYSVISMLRYISTFAVVLFIFIIVHTTFEENMGDYLRNHYILDVWLTRILYQNGLACWAAILFYESCLSIVIGLIYNHQMTIEAASIIGSSIFLLGILVSFIHETFKHKNSLSIVLAHWIIFHWLVYDTYFLSSGILTLVIYMLISLSFFRLVLFYVSYRRKELPMFRSGKVYSLLPRLTRAF